MNPMSFGLRQLARSEMEQGEYLLWYGQPDPKRWVPITIPLVLIGMPWTLFSFAWTMGSARFLFDGHGPWWYALPALFGLPFIIVGLGMLAAPYWAYMKARRTVYAITDRRIIIITNSKSKTVRSYADEDIGVIIRVDRRNGTGDVIFGPFAARKGIFGIHDARSVEGLLGGTFKKSGGAQNSLPGFGL